MLARTLATTGILGLIAMIAGGCCTAEKQQIVTLTAEKAALEAQNADLRDTINEQAGQVQDLTNQLAAARAAKPAEPVAPRTIDNNGPMASGWEKGLVGDRVTVGTDILFAVGRANLTPAGKAALDKIARQIKADYSGLPVRVYGYTDSDPIVKTRNLWADNLDLSANRAMAVVRYLWARGVPKAQVETVAMGDTHFATANTSKSGKAKNRRVEIIVIKSK